jgi:hypothetical protein
MICASVYLWEQGFSVQWFNVMTRDGKLPFTVDKTLAYPITKGIFYPPFFIM